MTEGNSDNSRAADTSSSGRHETTAGFRRQVLARSLIIVALVLAGMGVFNLLKSLKRAPATQPGAELVRIVRITTVTPREITLKPSGYGTAQSARLVPISAEVGGRATDVYEDLDVGCLVKRGDVLVQIDTTDYEIGLNRSEATVRQLQAEKRRLQMQMNDDRGRIELATRDRDLAENDYGRMQNIYKSGTGSEAQMEKAEQVLVQKETVLSNLQTALASYPEQLAALEAQIDSAKEHVKLARKNLERCSITAPFDGRIEMVAVEKDQYITPGIPVVTLADDSYIEIPVTLEGGVALRGFNLTIPAANGNHHWFNTLHGQPATITWTDGTPPAHWRGAVSRLERYSPETRTLSVVVKVTEPLSKHSPPLVAGMFCSVEIEGRKVPDAITIPASAVQFGDEVFIVDEQQRICSRQLEESYIVGNHVVVTAGLADGDRVVLERLPHAVDGMKVRVREEVSHGIVP